MSRGMNETDMARLCITTVTKVLKKLSVEGNKIEQQARNCIKHVAPLYWRKTAKWVHDMEWCGLRPFWGLNALSSLMKRKWVMCWECWRSMKTCWIGVPTMQKRHRLQVSRWKMNWFWTNLDWAWKLCINGKAFGTFLRDWTPGIEEITWLFHSCWNVDKSRSEEDAISSEPERGSRSNWIWMWVD